MIVIQRKNRVLNEISPLRKAAITSAIKKELKNLDLSKSARKRVCNKRTQAKN